MLSKNTYIKKEFKTLSSLCLALSPICDHEPLPFAIQHQVTHTICWLGEGGRGSCQNATKQRWGINPSCDKPLHRGVGGSKWQFFSLRTL